MSGAQGRAARATGAHDSYPLAIAKSVPLFPVVFNNRVVDDTKRVERQLSAINCRIFSF